MSPHRYGLWVLLWAHSSGIGDCGTPGTYNLIAPQACVKPCEEQRTRLTVRWSEPEVGRIRRACRVRTAHRGSG